MAVLKAVGGGKSLYGVLRYIAREDKTRVDLIGGWNIDPQNAYEEMTTTKKQWRKTEGRAYKHFVQSFHAEDGITPEEAHAIAAEFVERAALFRDYEVLYATHIDCGHVHTHIVVNSVSIRDGHKFRYAKPALEELKRLSDEIVQSHGYRLEDERVESENVTAWDQDLYQVLKKARDGTKSSWVYDTAAAVQKAMEENLDKNAFTSAMERTGYKVHWRSRNVTFKDSKGHRICASRLENLFKIPSVLERYGDPAKVRETLKDDLQRAQVNSSGRIFFRWMESPADQQAEQAAASARKLRVSVQKMKTQGQQQEIEAAACIYGSARCQDPKHLSDILEENGYRWNEKTQAIITPNGKAFWVTAGKPANAELTFAFEKRADTVRCSCKGRDHIVAANMQQVADQLKESVESGSTAAELLAEGTKISQACEVNWTDPGRIRIQLQDEWHELDAAAKAAAVLTHQECGSESRAQTRHQSGKQMQDLLTALQKAVEQADTREALTAAMRQTGYNLRWTQNGTLTFICPDGEHIRASRLEKKYKLPPIAAAYGQDRHVPKYGGRYAAAKLIRRIMTPGCSRQAFETAMTAAGYQINWRNGGTDATITAPDGQKMRLSSLAATFELNNVRQMLGNDPPGRSAEPLAENSSGRRSLQERIAAARDEFRQQRKHNEYRRSDFER